MPTEPATPAPAGEPGSGLLIGRLAGVPIYVAPTWFLVAALITWGFAGGVERAIPGIGPWRYAVSLAFAVLLYASVLVHELSHTLVALHAGLPVRRISLYLLGGVSEIDKPAATPGEEARIAAAGPALSLLLAVFGLLAATVVDEGTVAGLLVRALVWSNVVVGLFNLLPGLPLDGGRVLSAAVWKTTGRRHTGIAAAGWAGRIVAVIAAVLPSTMSIVYGSQPDLLDVAWGALLGSFIWAGATQSLHYAKLQQRLPLLSARRLTRPALQVPPDLPLAEALRQAREADVGAIAVVDGGARPVAIVHGAAVTATPEERRPWVPVGAVARGISTENVISADLEGEDLISALTAAPAREFLVLEHDGRILGVLVVSDVERAVASS